MPCIAHATKFWTVFDASVIANVLHLFWRFFYTTVCDYGITHSFVEGSLIVVSRLDHPAVVYSYIISSCLVFTVIIFWIMSFYPWIISCYHVSIGGMYVNYGMPTYLINTLYSYIMSSCLHCHHILNYVFPSFLVCRHNVKLCHAILFS